jgi:hypothetical protein
MSGAVIIQLDEIECLARYPDDARLNRLLG